MAQAERTGETVAVHVLGVVTPASGRRRDRSRDRWFFDTAQRIGALIRECDASTYLGDGKFAVLQRAVPRFGGVTLLARRLLAAAPPEATGSGGVGGSAAVGVSLWSRGLDAASLLARAELASIQARSSGSGLWCYESDDGPPPAVALHNRLRQALERDEFFLHFQPQVGLIDGRIEAVEALVRWRHPRRGVVAPGAFVSHAEHTGLIVELGAGILAEACRRCAQWNAGARRPVRVAVNVSAVQLREPGFVDAVAAILDRWRLPADLLELELTETVPLGETAIATLRKIGEAGVRLAIDDFGTGYCSLRYLDLLPVAKLKVAAEFIQGSSDRSAQRPMVAAVATIARRLDLETVAEGVEQRRQLEAARTAGCHAAQGYYLAEPTAEPFAAPTADAAGRSAERRGFA